MDCAHENAAEHNPQIGGRAEEDAHDGTEDGARAGNVEELDEIDAPRRHRDVIDTVLQTVGRRLAFGFSTEHTLYESSIKEIAENESR